MLVKEIFFSIQGEGPYAGKPAVFVRLAGCNLRCDFCDTDFSDGQEMELDDVVYEIARLVDNYCGTNFVVITGGEPTLQIDEVNNLIDYLNDIKFVVQIETNGSIETEINPKAHTVISPKGVTKVICRGRVFYKPLVCSDNKLDDFNWIADVYRGATDALNISSNIYFQPCDEGEAAINECNLNKAIQLAARHGGSVSVQLHKLIGRQ